MKTGLILILIGCLWIGIRIYQRVSASYEYKNKVSNYWTMADRASTISQKSEYINKFVNALEGENLHGVNANMFLITPATGYDENIKALKSLQNRLITISGMDENSFAYQTALQQITQQEQGEAEEMLSVFSECWQRENYYHLWNPVIFWVSFIAQFLLLTIGFIVICDDY